MSRMMTWRRATILALLAVALCSLRVTRVAAGGVRNRVLTHALDVHMGRARRLPHKPRLSSGVVYAVLRASGELSKRAMRMPATGTAAGIQTSISPGSQGCQNVYARHPGTGMPFDNVRVNQDCSLRRQAEEVIAINPKDPLNLIAGMNDSRIGFNHCAYAWSFDGGRTWGDQIPPFFELVLADGHAADACSDPSVTFDADGNAYIGGILFDVNSAASAVVVAKSNAGLGGAFYHTPVQGPLQTYSTTPLGVPVSDNDANIFDDKPLIVADAHAASAKSGNVYATWTRFQASTPFNNNGNGPIFFSQSVDGGATWSQRIEISGANAALCTFGSGEANPHACDQDQGSQPIVAGDGTVYVAFGNGNAPEVGINQHLIVSCPVTADCSQAASWTAPVKIADDIGTQPIGPDDATGCGDGDQCLPPNGYRLDDFVQGSLSVDVRGRLYFVWADFRNGGGSCAPLADATAASPPCDNDVFYSFSGDRGATWSAPFNITPAARVGVSAQWQPWSAVSARGQYLWVAYYDRSYSTCESGGCNDITLARVAQPAGRRPRVGYRRVTTSSMPNLLPANNRVQAGFLGDYMWLTVNPEGKPYVVWADTRGLNGTVEEDVYFGFAGDAMP